MALSPEELYHRGRTIFLEQLTRQLANGQEVGRSLDRAIMTLSGGALVFSMTFVGSLAPARIGLIWLFLSWTAFGLAIIAVAWAMRREQWTTHQSTLLTRQRLDQWDEMHPKGWGLFNVTVDVGTNRGVSWLNTGAVALFVVGVVMLCVFVGLNLWATRAPVSGPDILF
jgi:hypothetical protein